MGANVIKIERAGAGDMFRSHDLLRQMGRRLGEPEFSRLEPQQAVDRAQPEEPEGARASSWTWRRRPTSWCRISGPACWRKLGYGYEDFKAVNPRIIYCSGSGYGEEGPYVDRPGQDMLIQGLAGLIANTGRGDQAPVPAGAGPRRPDRRDEHGLRHPVGALLSREDRQGPEDRGEPAGRHARASRPGICRRAQSRRGFRAAEFRHRPSRHAGAVRHLRDAATAATSRSP